MKVASISNLKIGKKIAAVLGGIVLLLTGLSGLSLWANHTTERLANASLNRLTKSKLAEQVSSTVGASI